MPLTINVGLSRKTSENYQSRGVSINVTAELDQALLASPGRLQDQIASLYDKASTALQHQVDCNGHSGKAQPVRPQENTPAQSQPNPRPATNSQLRALNAIAGRLNTNLEDECRHEFGCQSANLSIRQASELIDLLKARQSNNGHRDQTNSPTRSARR